MFATMVAQRTNLATGLSIPEPAKYIPCAKRVQHYKFTGWAISKSQP
jgi:hypothetical protein